MVADESKTRAELIEELRELRQRISASGDASTRSKSAEETFSTATRLQEILRSNPAVIYTCHAGGDYGATFISENVRQQMCYGPREFTTIPSFWADRIHPEDRTRVFDDLEKLYEHGRHTHEYRFLHGSGTYIWVRDECRLIRNEDGTPKEIFGYWVDITERKGVEQQRNLLATEVAALKMEMEGRYGLDNMVGRDPKMQAVYETIVAVSDTRATVLIQGETGTGKELVARAIHYNSPERDKPFVKVDCGAMAENLLESELFGHVRGAFTGAVRDRQGRFELADTGTVFLDEIQNISMQLQSKLLRVVQEGCFEKVGGTKTLRVDARVIAATNGDPEKMVAEGRLRKDLYYRLNVVPVRLPPLRERRGDIPLLAVSLMDKLSERHGKRPVGFTEKAMDRLASHDWPGNVRELENAIEQAIVLARNGPIRSGDIRLPELVARPLHAGALERASRDAEAHIIKGALERTRWNKKRAAALLGISRSALYEKLKRYGIAGSPA